MCKKFVCICAQRVLSYSIIYLLFYGLQAYCLKAKEMDDMEINSAVSGQIHQCRQLHTYIRS